MMLLKPKVAILDEIDSGLDVDALNRVSHGIQIAREQNPTMAFLVITHYQRLLNYIVPDLFMCCRMAPSWRLVIKCWHSKSINKDIQFHMLAHDPHVNHYKSPKGLNADIVKNISAQKNEPDWMLAFRLKALEIFEQKPMPTWGADLSGLATDDIYYYIKPLEKQHT